jgi:dTDP-glucose pyrophosphorylase
MQLVILTAGRARRLWPLTLSQPKALLSVGGRPAIFHMLMPLLQQGLRDVTFVVSPRHKQALEIVVGKALANSDASLRWIEQPEPGGPGQAFALTADVISGPTLLLLADTLAQLPSDYSCDWIGVASIAPGDHSMWCTVAVDDRGLVNELIDKPTAGPSPDCAAVGLYFFKDPAALRQAMAEAAEETDGTIEFQLKPIIDRYMKAHPLRAFEIAEWRDLGTLRGYNEAVRSLLPCRSFTGLTVFPDGRVLKRPGNGARARRGEAAWFRAISSDSSLLSPRFLGEDADREGYALEYLDYLTLAEYYTFGQLSAETLPEIISQLLELLSSKLWKPCKLADMQDRAEAIYLRKTHGRLQSWDRQDLLALSSLEINGTRVHGFHHLWDAARPLVDELISTSSAFGSTIHGDLSFGNILYSPRSGMFRLLDPRGDFGATGSLGDIRYDGAKLRQCYHGCYDLIVADLFHVAERRPGVFEFWMYPAEMPGVVEIDNLLAALNFKPRQTATIEALLFLSMLPLHNDSPRRQLAFLITAIQCLTQLVNP